MANFWDADADYKPAAKGGANFWEKDADFVPPSFTEDVAKGGASGVGHGAIGTFGAAGDLRHTASAAADFLGEKLGVSPDTIKGSVGVGGNLSWDCALTRANAPRERGVSKRS